MYVLHTGYSLAKLFEDFYILACENLAKMFPACKDSYETLSYSPSYWKTQEMFIQ